MKQASESGGSAISHKPYFPVKEDYTSITQVLEFQPGETQHQIEVYINDDMRIERNETFQLYLIAGVGVHLSPFARTEITITNDDGKITLL